MSFIQEFKTFAMKGNVVDMAVGIIIGGAFGKIVSSLVSDIIMPPIGLLIGGVKFDNLKIVLKHAHLDEATGKMTEAVSINYGNFIGTTLDFLIIAFSIFLFIKMINSLKRKEETAAAPTPAAPPAPTKEEELLTEIRDLLKTQKK
ncbi:MAG: large-conductance mechanosensitive channel protein MscL [Odoribacter splanchnicus]|nr:large-conductance mechanosensitive channel protein MscL [Odoribacter splanchnicus]MBD9180092.1 large-conductance mechanosensitive channel protein MscL [Odoribacter splanchnicus]